MPRWPMIMSLPAATQTSRAAVSMLRKSAGARFPGSKFATRRQSFNSWAYFAGDSSFQSQQGVISDGIILGKLRCEFKDETCAGFHAPCEPKKRNKAKHGTAAGAKKSTPQLSYLHRPGRDKRKKQRGGTPGANGIKQSSRQGTKGTVRPRKTEKSRAFVLAFAPCVVSLVCSLRFVSGALTPSAVF